jgi:hypothetical protein
MMVCARTSNVKRHEFVVCFILAKREIAEGEFADTALQVDYVPLYSSQDTDQLASAAVADNSSNDMSTEDEDGCRSNCECNTNMFYLFIGR